LSVLALHYTLARTVAPFPSGRWGEPVLVDLRKAQYLAGHRHVSSTEEYKQQLLDELQADVKKFHPLG
jgi:hypothetical protein